MQLASTDYKGHVTTWKEAASVFNKMPQIAHWYVRFSIQGAPKPLT